MGFIINKIILAGILAFVIVIIYVPWNNHTDSSFICPNDYQTVDEYIKGTAKWASEELKKNPEMTSEELLGIREKLLYEYACERSYWME